MDITISKREAGDVACTCRYASLSVSLKLSVGEAEEVISECQRAGIGPFDFRGGRGLMDAVRDYLDGAAAALEAYAATPSDEEVQP